MNERLAILLTRIVGSCTQCGNCQEICVFLKEFAIEPKVFAEKLLREGPIVDTSLLYSCNLCGICKELCPEEIDLRELFLLLRQERVGQGDESIPAHKWVKERQEWIVKHFALVEGQGRNRGNSERAFFPGCMLCGYDPSLVLRVYRYLRSNNPYTGIILNCCGALFEGLGDQSGLTKTLESVTLQIEQSGASSLITACPTCYRVFKRYLPHYEVFTVYENIANETIPKTKVNRNQQFFLFHPCSTRHDNKVKQAVRRIMKKIGYAYKEDFEGDEHNWCCGMGGAVGLTNPVLACIIGHERTEAISRDIVTYCAACRDALVRYRPAIHLLDLVFNSNWKTETVRQPLEETQMRDNLIWLRSQIATGL